VQYVNAFLLMGAIMLELRVYCYGVLRYSITGDWDMVQELWSRGYYVEVNSDRRSRPGLGARNRNDQFMSINAIVHHDNKFDSSKLAELQPEGEYYTFGF
jgi:hypothetical protein